MCDALSFTLSIVVGVVVLVLLAVSSLWVIKLVLNIYIKDWIDTFNLVKDTLLFWKKKDK